MAVVEFEWDESNRRHIAEHRVRAEEAEGVILNNPADLDRQNRNGEERILQVGETGAGRILVVVSMFSGRRIRVITAWDANQKLARYWRSLPSGTKGKS